MHNNQLVGWSLLVLIGGSTIVPILGYPSVVTAGQQPAQVDSEWTPAFAPAPGPAPIPAPEARKFAEKPNATKKVVTIEDRNDIDDIQTNQIQVT